MPNLTGVGHRVEYVDANIQIREPISMKKTLLQSVTRSQVSKEVSEERESYSKQSSPKSRRTSRRSKSPSRKRVEIEKNWRRECSVEREALSQIPRLVSSDYSPEQHSSEEEMTSEQMTSEQYEFRRRTREVWDETSHMRYRLPETTISVPLHQSKKFHKFLSRLFRWSSSRRSESRGNAAAAISMSPKPKRSESSQRALGKLFASQLTQPLTSTSKQSSQLQGNTRSHRTNEVAMHPLETMIENSFILIKQWCQSSYASVTNVHKRFPLLWVLLLILFLLSFLYFNRLQTAHYFAAIYERHLSSLSSSYSSSSHRRSNFETSKQTSIPAKDADSLHDELVKLRQIVFSLDDFVKGSDFVSSSELASNLNYLERKIKTEALADKQLKDTSISSDHDRKIDAELLATLKLRLDHLEERISNREASEVSQTLRLKSELKRDILSDQSFVQLFLEGLKSTVRLENDTRGEGVESGRLISLESKVKDMDLNLRNFLFLLLQIEADGFKEADKNKLHDWNWVIEEFSQRVSRDRQRLYSRVEALQSELDKHLDQSRKTNVGSEEALRRIESSLLSLGEDKVGVERTLEQLGVRLSASEQRHASLGLSGEQLENKVGQLTLELTGNLTELQLRLEEYNSNLKLLLNASRYQQQQQILDRVGANFSHIQSQLLPLKSLISEELPRVHADTSALQQSLLGVEQRLQLIEQSVLSARNCCNETQGSVSNLRASLTQLEFKQDLFDTLRSEVSQINKEVLENRRLIDLLNTQESAVDSERTKTLHLEFITEEHLGAALDKLQREMQLLYNSSCSSTVRRSSESSAEFVDRSYFESHFFNNSYLNYRLIELIRAEVSRAILEDGTGMADFALESAGGSIVGVRCSETYTAYSSIKTLWIIPLWYETPSPRTVIQPTVEPGNCWPFIGTSGQVVIHLARPIRVTWASYQHIPASISPSGTISSAPRNISLLGLNSEHDESGVLLANFEYQISAGSPALQTFRVNSPEHTQFSFVEFFVHSNYGNDNYTCLYRFRVHGEVH